MLRAVVIAALLMVQLVSAVTPDSNAANGVTVLKPNGGDSAHGVTVMSATSGADAATSACSTGNCQQPAPAPASNAAPAATPVSTATGKPMHPALINHPTNQCGCPVEDDACACNKPKFVAPEIKAEPCGCMNEEVCGCRSSSSSSVVTHTVVDECGCLHLEVCGCRRSSVVPETRENTVVPELRDRDTVVTTCGCPEEDTSCGCRKPQYVAPEVKADPCACANQVEVECGCSHFRPNF